MKTDRLLRQLPHCLGLWLFSIGCLEAFRGLFVWRFRHLISAESGAPQLLAVLLNGARYDARVASWVIAPCLLLALAGLYRDTDRLAARVRFWLGIMFLALTALLGAVTLEYFREFNDQLNYFMFNLYYDDARAIFGTIFQEYHPLQNLAGVALAIALGTAVLLWLRRPGSPAAAAGDNLARQRPWAQALCGAVLLVLYVAGIRGSFGRRPVQLKDAAITHDEFLNKTVLNPYLAIRYALKASRETASSKGFHAFVPDGRIVPVLESVRGGTAADLRSVDDYLARSAAGHGGTRPRHVFVLLMESYEAWPLFQEYLELGIAARLKELADHGLRIRSFLPAATGTIESMAAVITGLADAGVHTNYRPTAARPYPTSLPATMRRLGYRTRMFYSGFLSWQRLDSFCRDQGFDEVYGGGSMGDWRNTNEWGVRDGVLFDFVARTVTDDTPSFNLMLTTGFHPPYNVDVRREGFPLTQVPPAIAAKCSTPPDLAMLGHFWYADHCLGEFVARAEASLQAPLFAMTGDHAGRRYITARPTLAERALVPLVLYGPEVLAGRVLPPDAAGCHLDIAPTLIELCAPAGFGYWSLGQDLLSPRETPCGVGLGRAVTASWVVDFSGLVSTCLVPDGPQAGPALPDCQRLKQRHDVVHGVSWWRIVVGPDLTGPAAELATGPGH